MAGKRKVIPEQPVKEDTGSMVEVIGLNGHMKGRTFRCSEPHARKLVEKGQAKYL